MDNPKSQLIERLQAANTVLVTVSRNPSVDQLAACIGLTLIINKLSKHGSAVFSGKVPSTLEFLKPEQTIEKNTDSLRDFIVALDKNKADKLRYKLEDDVVKIFITPYRTSLSEKDLKFGQGDFNIELIVALGVQNQEDLDQAITAHGRILHDATIVSINTTNTSNIGGINWNDPQASSLCELISSLAGSLGDNLIDEQIATALLTGIVSETARFSNEKTSSQTMSISAALMGAGANQQLVATKLSEASQNSDTVDEKEDSDQEEADGTLNIDHSSSDSDDSEDNPTDSKLPSPADMPTDDDQSADDGGNNDQSDAADQEAPQPPTSTDSRDSQTSSRLVTQPPQLGGVLTANSRPEPYEPSSDPLSNITMPASEGDVLSKVKDIVSPLEPSSAASATDTTSQQAGFTPPPPSWVPPFEDKQLEAKVDKTLAEPDSKLSDLESIVDSPHIEQSNTNVPNVDNARDKVDKVISQTTAPFVPEPIQALNALPLEDNLHPPVDNSQLPPNNNPNIAVTPTTPTTEAEAAPPVPPPIISMPYNNVGTSPDQNSGQ